MIVEEQPIDELILCWKSRELGHNMKISLIQYLDEEGHAKTTAKQLLQHNETFPYDKRKK